MKERNRQTNQQRETVKRKTVKRKTYIREERHRGGRIDEHCEPGKIGRTTEGRKEDEGSKEGRRMKEARKEEG